MAASYPDAIKVFAAKTDHVDDVMASHVNDLQNEVAAIETELGTDPRGSYVDAKTRLDDLVDKSNAQTVAGVKTFTDAVSVKAVSAPTTPSADYGDTYMTASGVSPNREVALRYKNEAGIEITVFSWLV